VKKFSKSILKKKDKKSAAADVTPFLFFSLSFSFELITKNNQNLAMVMKMKAELIAQQKATSRYASTSIIDSILHNFVTQTKQQQVKSQESGDVREIVDDLLRVVY